MTQEISLPSRYAPITKISAVVTRHAIGVDTTPALPDCPDGFELLDFDLCVGKKQSDVHTYLCVSRERIDEGPITSIISLEGEDNDEEKEEDANQASGANNDCAVNVPPGYTLLDIDVNQGGSTEAQRGKRMYLAYSRSPEHVPVVDIRFVKGGKRTKPPNGFEKVDGNLNGGGGGAPHVYLCLKSEGPITGIRILEPADEIGNAGSDRAKGHSGFEQLSKLNLSAIGSVHVAAKEAQRASKNMSKNQQIVKSMKSSTASGASDQYDFVPDQVITRSNKSGEKWCVFLGNRAQAVREDVLEQLGVAHVVCCMRRQEEVTDAIVYTNASLENQKEIVRFTNKIEFLEVSSNVNKQLDKWQDAGENALVYCRDGDSHAPALIMAYLLHQHHDMSLKSAWQRLRTRRHKDSVTKPIVRFFTSLCNIELANKGEKSMTNGDWHKYDGKGLKGKRPKITLQGEKVKTGEQTQCKERADVKTGREKTSSAVVKKATGATGATTDTAEAATEPPAEPESPKPEPPLPVSNAFVQRSGGVPLTGLRIVASGDTSETPQDGYSTITAVNWNGKTIAARYGEGCPITDVSVYRAPDAVPRFQDWEVLDVLKPEEDASYLSGTGECGVWKMCTAESKPSGLMHPAVFNILNSSEGANGDGKGGYLLDAYQVYGRDEHGGTFDGIVYSRVSGRQKDQEENGENWILEGCIRTPSASGKNVSLEPLKLRCRNGFISNESTLSSTLSAETAAATTAAVTTAAVTTASLTTSSDSLASSSGSLASSSEGKKDKVDDKGDEIGNDSNSFSERIEVLAPGALSAITDVAVCVGHDGPVPDGFVKCAYTLIGGFDGNVAAGMEGDDVTPMWLCVKRDPKAKPITKIGVIWNGFEAADAGQDLVATDTSGVSLNLNANGKNGGVAQIVLVLERGQAKQKGAAVLVDVGFIRGSSSEADLKGLQVCKKTHSDLKMGGDINQGLESGASADDSEVKSRSGGHRLFVAARFTKNFDPIAGHQEPHACNGVYDLHALYLATPASRRKLSLVALAKAPEARRCQIRFDLHRETSDAWSIGSGVVVRDLREAASASTSAAGAMHARSHCLVAGRWNRGKSRGTFSMRFSEHFADARVLWSGNILKKKFTSMERRFVKDAYLKIAFKRDFGTFMRGGKIMYSSVCQGNSIDDIIAADVTVMGGSNAVETPDGNGKTEVVRRSVITEPPRHLIVTVKRTLWDPTTMQQRKDLRDVTFKPILQIPDVPEDVKDTFFGEAKDSAESPTISASSVLHDASKSRAYGLYGVVVHAGTTATSGHYYSFARHSDAPDLFRANSKHSPWMKFNDENVSVSSWEAMTRHIRSGKTASAYLLFYRQLAPNYRESVRIAQKRRSAAPTQANDDVLRPVVEDWRQEDPRWSVLPRWVDNIKQKESQRLCLDIPSRQGKFFQQLLEKDAIYRTGCDPSGFRNIVHGVVSNNNALPPTPSKAKAVTKIWSGDGYILSTEISRHEQTYARPLKTPLPFPSVPRLRIASSVVEEEEMFAPLPDMN
jgi:hypothetical protein